MTTAAKIGHGATFVWGSTTVAEIKRIGGPGAEAEMIDVTNLDSTDNTKEFLPGLVDSGEVSFEGNFLDSATQEVLRTAMYARTTATCVLNWPFTTTAICTFVGAVKSFGTSLDSGAMAFSAAIKVLNKPAIT